MKKLFAIAIVSSLIGLTGCPKSKEEKKAEPAAKVVDETKKPDEAKPDEAKPDEAKPDEAKQPDEAKPDEAKPDEAKTPDKAEPAAAAPKTEPAK